MDNAHERPQAVMVKLPVPCMPPSSMEFSWDGAEGYYQEGFAATDDDGQLMEHTLAMLSQFHPEHDLTRVDDQTLKVSFTDPAKAFAMIAVEAVLQMEGRGFVKPGTVDKFSTLLEMQVL